MNVKDVLKLVDEALGNSNISGAKSLLDKEIKNNPNIYELNFKLGIVNQILGNFHEAKNYYEKTTLIKPDFSPAFCNLGIVYDKLNNKNSAIKNYLIAIKLDEKNFKALYNLANCYLDSGDQDNAQKYYYRSIEIEPRNIHAYTSLFQIFDTSNNFDKLSDILLKAQKVFNTNHSYLNFMDGIFEYRKKNYLKAISILEKVQIDKADISKNTIILNTLAKCHDHLGKYEEAFKAFERSNKITFDAYKNKYNKDTLNNSIQKRIDYFSDPNFKSWDKKKIKDNHVDPVFLVGFPRSGTTLLDVILRTHNSVEVLEEKPLINKIVDELKLHMDGDFSNLNKVDENFLKKLRLSYINDFNNYLPIEKGKTYVDKFPLNIIYIAEINLIFPNSKYILALRNPYDCVLSCFMQPFTPNDAMSNFYNLQDATRFYDQIMKLWMNYEKKLNLQIYSIKYEDTVNKFDISISNLLQFLNLKWNDQLREFYKTAKKRGIINTPSYNQINQPIYKNSIGRWKNYQEYFRTISPILKKWSNKFNY